MSKWQKNLFRKSFNETKQNWHIFSFENIFMTYRSRILANILTRIKNVTTLTNISNLINWNCEIYGSAEVLPNEEQLLYCLSVQEIENIPMTKRNEEGMREIFSTNNWWQICNKETILIPGQLA
jgi:hypothetical protein